MENRSQSIFIFIFTTFSRCFLKNLFGIPFRFAFVLFSFSFFIQWIWHSHFFIVWFMSCHNVIWFHLFFHLKERSCSLLCAYIYLQPQQFQPIWIFPYYIVICHWIWNIDIFEKLNQSDARTLRKNCHSWCLFKAVNHWCFDWKKSA